MIEFLFLSLQMEAVKDSFERKGHLKFSPERKKDEALQLLS